MGCGRLAIFTFVSLACYISVRAAPVPNPHAEGRKSLPVAKSWMSILRFFRTNMEGVHLNNSTWKDVPTYFAEENRKLPLEVSKTANWIKVIRSFKSVIASALKQFSMRTESVHSNGSSWTDFPLQSEEGRRTEKIMRRQRGGLAAYRTGWGSLLKRFSSRIETMYEDTATLVDLPDQPDLMVQMLLSLIVSKSNFTPAINDAIIDCLSTMSKTKAENWGLYNSKRFTPTLLQAEYYADVSEEDSLTFPLTIDEFIRSGELTNCVFAKNVGLTSTGSLVRGRTTIAPRTGEIVSSVGSIPSWTIGAVVGGLVLIAAVGLITLFMREQRIYREEDYGGTWDGEEDNKDLIQRDEILFSGADPLSRELRTIAGQRRGALLHQV